MIKKLCTQCSAELRNVMDLEYQGKRNRKGVCEHCGLEKYVTEYDVTQNPDKTKQTEKTPNTRITVTWDLDIRTVINATRLAERWGVTQGEVADSVFTAFMRGRKRKRADEDE